MHHLARKCACTFNAQAILPIHLNDTPMEFLPVFDSLTVRGEIGYAHEHILTHQPCGARFVPARFVSLLQGRKLGRRFWGVILHVRRRTQPSASRLPSSRMMWSIAWAGLSQPAQPTIFAGTPTAVQCAGTA